MPNPHPHPDLVVDDDAEGDDGGFAGVEGADVEFERAGRGVGRGRRDAADGSGGWAGCGINRVGRRRVEDLHGGRGRNAPVGHRNAVADVRYTLVCRVVPLLQLLSENNLTIPENS